MSTVHARQQRFNAFVGTVAMTAVLVVGVNYASAQSGTRAPNTQSRTRAPNTQSRTRARSAQSRTRAPRGSATKSSIANRVALDGYCAVCVIEMKKWVKGNARIHATYDGMRYLFPGQKQKEMFLANPAKYVPALGGDCTVCLVNMGKRVRGTIHHAALNKNRLFLFTSQKQRQEFLAHPAKYVDVDLALDGICAVCRAEMNKDVPGKPEFAAYHRGMRYLFPTAKLRKMFLADPAKYAATSKLHPGVTSVKPADEHFLGIPRRTARAGSVSRTATGVR